MFTANIKDIKRDTIHASQTHFLDVEVEILDAKGKVVETRKFGYPLDTSDKAIKAEIAQFLRVYEDDKKRSVKNKEADALNDKAEKTAEALKGEAIEAAPAESEEEAA